MMLLSVPLLGWFFEQEKHNLQGIIAGLLDTIGAQMGMTKIEQTKNDEFRMLNVESMTKAE
jgi:hypothetical protein